MHYHYQLISVLIIDIDIVIFSILIIDWGIIIFDMLMIDTSIIWIDSHSFTFSTWSVLSSTCNYHYQKGFEVTEGITKKVEGQTDNTVAKRNRTKGQTMIVKIENKQLINWTPLKTGGEGGGLVYAQALQINRSCPTSGTHRVSVKWHKHHVIWESSWTPEYQETCLLLYRDTKYSMLMWWLNTPQSGIRKHIGRLRIMMIYPITVACQLWFAKPVSRGVLLFIIWFPSEFIWLFDYSVVWEWNHDNLLLV